MADIGWFTDPGDSGPAVPPALASNSGTWDDAFTYNPVFGAAVVGYVGPGTVVWSTVWTPVGSDGPPAITYPDGLNGETIRIAPAPFEFPSGLLEISATLNGVPCTNGPLTMVMVNGQYGSFAWDHGHTLPGGGGGGGLPELLAPIDLCYLAAGNPITPDSLYDDFSPMSGHDRKRKVQTYAPRVVSVEAILEPAQARIVDDWFENVLNVGVEQFSARVARLGPNSSYWRAEWVSPIQWEPMALGRWRISGELLLTGEGREFPPLTTTLEIEFGMALTGTAAIYAPVELEFEFGMALRAHNPFAFEFAMALTNPSFELREDGGFELREDDSFEWRN